MALYESGEMYLETILVLSQELDKVRSIDVAHKMNFSKPSVSTAMKHLREDGYVIFAQDGGITLTDSGMEIATKIYDRHKTLVDALNRIGVPAEVACEDACRIEHVISDTTMEALKGHMDKVAELLREKANEQ